MPIYAYRCEACGFAEDVLQKMSADLLTICPSCSKDAFRKQVTAAGFQLKGSGWYVTDFRNGNAGNGGKAAPAAADGSKDSAAQSGDGSAAAPATTPAATPAPVSATPAPAPARPKTAA
jgi:putative FmdB family regulatory protein